MPGLLIGRSLANVPVQRSTVTITFTGAASLGAVGNLPLFTITGQVIVLTVGGVVTTNLAGAGATLALGVTGSTSLFIGATTATTMLTTAALWVSTTPTANGIALPAAVSGNGTLIETNLVGTVAVAAITSGVLRVDVWWAPWSANGALV